MGRHVYTIGETVLDFVFRQNEIVAAIPGGAMLNSAVSLGRTKINVSLISEISNDQVGNLIVSFLQKNEVNINCLYKHQDGKTAIAMAFLNDKNDASYVFYKIHPKKRLQVRLPEFTQDDILLFGSFFGIDPLIRETLLSIVLTAKQKGCLIIYDPNFRKPHASKLSQLKPMIIENINLADVVRGSNEDFDIIFGSDSIIDISQTLGKKVPVIIMTKNSEGVYLTTQGMTWQFPVQKITPVSTIGAGDSFNAGLIYGIIGQNIYARDLPNIPRQKWEKVIALGVTFASEVCMSYENYVSPKLLSQLI